MVLVGPPGAGKTTVGRCWPSRLGVAFPDIDAHRGARRQPIATSSSTTARRVPGAGARGGRRGAGRPRRRAGARRRSGAAPSHPGAAARAPRGVPVASGWRRRPAHRPVERAAAARRREPAGDLQALLEARAAALPGGRDRRDRHRRPDPDEVVDAVLARLGLAAERRRRRRRGPLERQSGRGSRGACEPRSRIRVGGPAAAVRRAGRPRSARRARCARHRDRPSSCTSPPSPPPPRPCATELDAAGARRAPRRGARRRGRQDARRRRLLLGGARAGRARPAPTWSSGSAAAR